MTREFGSAIVWRRATSFVVSPIAAFSLRYALLDQVSNDNHARTNGDAGLQRHIAGGFQVANGFEYGEARKDRPLGIVLVRGRISEIREHPVAQILRDHAAKGFDFIGAAGVKRSDDVGLLLRIEAR
jgi:hypothetical protein